MRFTISDELFLKYSDAVIGLVVARGVDNSGESEEIAKLLRFEEEKIRSDFSLENLSQNPLVRNWRVAHKKFGSEERCSSEALIRTVLKGNSIRHISPLVDLYNYVSLKYLTPVGGEDVDKITGNVYLKPALGTENFMVLGGSELEHPKKGEIVYSDDKQVICRRWNWRESEATKLTSETQNAILVIDALPPVTREIVASAVSDLAGLVKKFCGAQTTAFILNSENTRIDF